MFVSIFSEQQVKYETNGATNTLEERLFWNADLTHHMLSESIPNVTFPLDGAENLLTCTMRLCA